MAKFARGYIFVGLLILISAPRAHAGLVQTSSGTPGAPVSTYSVGFSSPVTTSDLVLVAIGTNVPTATITSVTDALGNTFTPATGLVADPNRGLGEQIWMAFLKASGTDTVAVSVSQAANLHERRVVAFHHATAAALQEVVHLVAADRKHGAGALRRSFPFPVQSRIFLLS